VKRLGNSAGRAAAALVAALVLIPIGHYLRFPPGPRPLCHRGIDSAFQQWMLATGQTNAYPNAEGNGPASLAMVQPYFGQRIQQYAYIPGLREDDPEDLVFMYMKEKTRRTWHADEDHSIFIPRRWMVLSREIEYHGTCPEGGELLDTPQFRKRIMATIAFLKDNQRPYWQAVANEQLAFLRSVKE